MKIIIILRFWNTTNEREESGLERRFFRYYLSFIIQFPLADMRPMANMRFSRAGICAQRSGCGFVMCPSFGAALLTMAPFGIWHDLAI
jgi:hypothetical protein